MSCKIKFALFESRTEHLTANQMNYLRAVADGISSGLSSANVIGKYKLGNSANVPAAAKVLKEKDFVQESDKKVTLTDPVMALWLKSL